MKLWSYEEIHSHQESIAEVLTGLEHLSRLYC